MANEGYFTHSTGVAGLDVVISNGSQQYWSTGSTMQSDYDLATGKAATEHDGSGVYYFDMPTVAADWYLFLVRDTSDVFLSKSWSQFWDGTKFVDKAFGYAKSGMLTGTIDTGTFTPTTTVFEADDITEATTGHYLNRGIMFVSGTLKDQTKEITAYSLQGSNGRFTCSAFTEAPANDDVFVIV